MLVKIVETAYDVGRRPFCGNYEGHMGRRMTQYRKSSWVWAGASEAKVLKELEKENSSIWFLEQFVSFLAGIGQTIVVEKKIMKFNETMVLAIIFGIGLRIHWEILNIDC